MDPSITTWNRIEPNPRRSGVQPDLARSVASQVRDPLWFLTRQWQFGEFQGEDAASPQYVEAKVQFSPLTGWRPSGSPEKDFKNFKKGNPAPLEVVVEREGFFPNLSTAIELGQQFERLLKEEGLGEFLAPIREAYPCPDSEEQADQDLVRFLLVCGRKAINGWALLGAAQRRQELRSLISNLGLGSPEKEKLQTVLKRFKIWVEAVFGEISQDDADSWKPECLEYGVQVRGNLPDGTSGIFDAYPDRQGQLDWYTFDFRGSSSVSSPSNQSTNRLPNEESQSVIPTHVRFRGMPTSRWWQFENGITDFGDLKADLTDLAKVIVADFMLVHSNDWFVLPLVHPVGYLCQVESLVVHDVFGGQTWIQRAEEVDRARLRNNEKVDRDRLQNKLDVPWSMYSTTSVAENLPKEFMILPPSAPASTQFSEPLEEIRFLRDEMANMVWAIEHTLENGIGLPWSGDERARSLQDQREITSMSESSASLKYKLQTTVPANWIPFVPIQIDELKRQVELQRATMQGLNGRDIFPIGRILQPTNGQNGYRIREEEISRIGLRVSRVVCRTRWHDGSTHLWIARQRRAGRGEGSSGLKFDIALPTQVPAEQP